jgi:hypothetical protein
MRRRDEQDLRTTTTRSKNLPARHRGEVTNLNAQERDRDDPGSRPLREGPIVDLSPATADKIGITPRRRQGRGLHRALPAKAATAPRPDRASRVRHRSDRVDARAAGTYPTPAVSTLPSVVKCFALASWSCLGGAARAAVSMVHRCRTACRAARRIRAKATSASRRRPRSATAASRSPSWALRLPSRLPLAGARRPQRRHTPASRRSRTAGAESVYDARAPPADLT